MNTKTRWWILTGALVLLLITGVMLMGRDVTVNVDGQTRVIHTHALTVSQALRGMGIKLTSNDQVEPASNTWLSGVQTITLDRSRPIVIWVDPIGTHIDLSTPAKTAREALTLVGITPAADDEIKVNGTPIEPDDLLPAGVGVLLQYIPALPIQLTGNSQPQVIRSTAATVGQALWAKSIHIKGGDLLSSPFTQALTNALDLTWTIGTPITISVDGKTIQSLSAAKTVGEALAENDISLQNLDYSSPSEDSSLPQDGKITVVRVTVVALDQQKVDPYNVEYTTDNSLSAGARNVTRTGQNGISLEYVLVRYENGTEVSRETESEVVLQTVINEQVTTGPQAANNSVPVQTSTADAVGTINTSYGTLSYYLAVPVHVTSYSPCRAGGSTCSNLTRSGDVVTIGVLAVTNAWYAIFKGYQIYIPGYGIGVVKDTGGGIPGQNWIDLGYSDDDYVSWSKTLKVYFLTPVPPGFSGSLP